jgi:hypothetical protein
VHRLLEWWRYTARLISTHLSAAPLMEEMIFWLKTNYPLTYGELAWISVLLIILLTAFAHGIWVLIKTIGGKVKRRT